MATQVRPARPPRRAITAILLTGAVLSLGVRTALASTVTPPSFESGTYDVWQHGTNDDPLRVPTDRVVEMHVHKLTIQVSTYVDGALLKSRVLVPAGQIVYDTRLGRWYQDFETAPNNPKVLHERVRVTIRNDEPGTYDIAYRRRDNTWASEILVKRPAPAG